MSRNKSYYVHKSQGVLEYDPKKNTKHYCPWWVLLVCDQGMQDFYCWLSKKHGKPLDQNKLWGPHISVIKGWIPPDKTKWGLDNNKTMTFYYTNNIRWDNGRHAWLDCWSEELNEVRMGLGYDEPKMSYHLTLGRTL